MNTLIDTQDRLSVLASTPLMQRRVEITTAIKSGAINPHWMNDFVQRLGNTPTHADAWTQAQSLLNGNTGAISLTTPEEQLIWAGALAIEQAGTNQNHSVYKAIIDHPDIRREKQAAAHLIDRSLSNSSISVSWGMPGSWFWFAPEQQHVNLDPMYALITGYEHARAVMAHEIGHSQLTLKFPAAMLALKKNADMLREKGQHAELTADEFSTLCRNEAEFELRMALYNSGEDSCVNRYAVNMGAQLQQNLGESLNHISFVLQGIGTHLLQPQTTEPTGKTPASPAEQASAQLLNLSRALTYAFYTSTGLIENNETEWRKLGVDPDAIRKLSAPHKAGDGFQQLIQASTGPSGLANLQPTSFDYMLLSFMFRTRALRYADHRNMLLDDLWETYAAEPARIVLDEVSKQSLQKARQPSQQQGAGNRAGNNGQSQNAGNGAQSSAAPSPSQNQGSAGGKAEAGQNNHQNNHQNNRQNNSQNSERSADGQPQSGKSQSDSGGTTGTGKESGQSQSSSQKSPSQTTGRGETVKVEGQHSIELPERLPETPAEARRRAQASTDQNDLPRKLDAETIAALLRAAREGKLERVAVTERQGTPSANDGGHFAAIATHEGGTARGVDLAQLAQGDWKEYQARINELSPFIRLVERKLDYVRSQQVHRIRTLSNQREMMPQDSQLLRRLDQRAHIDMQLKIRTGQKIDRRDLARWRKDEVHTEPTTSEVVTLIDGSGSMDHILPGGGKRIWSAVQSGAVLYEAGKKAKFDSFVGVWGDDQLRIIASPGDSPSKVGEAFERAKNGINSGTLLSASLQQVTQHLAHHRNSNGCTYSGNTHILIISDGELNRGDETVCLRMLDQLYRLGKHVTIDIAILGGPRQTPLHTIADVLSARSHGSRINVVHADTAAEIPVKLAGLLEQRFKESGSAPHLAVPDSVKRQNLARAARAMSNTP